MLRPYLRIKPALWVQTRLCRKNTRLASQTLFFLFVDCHFRGYAGLFDEIDTFLLWLLSIFVVVCLFSPSYSAL